ncbi:hypothetical protein [Aminobacterium mobile]|uniref:hypothetical protein n=1 Tax=Aminobacterium mobile TaxID=81467 RepID=UPI002FDB2AF6
MISCTEFILAYNELFNYLYEKDGMAALEEFWRTISDQYLAGLDQLVREKGIRGMEEYWGRTLEEEAAGYTITSSESRFTINMYKCPSVGLLNRKGVEKCPHYCDHCDALYRPIMERYGFSYKIEYIDRSRGSCRVTIEPEEDRTNV